MSRRATTQATIAAACGALAVLAGCGSGGSSKTAQRIVKAPPVPPNTLTIYASLARQGTAAAQNDSMVSAEQLAIEEAHGRVGKYRIRFIEEDNSVSSTGTWDPGTVRQDAQTAAADPSAIAYIGDDTSGATAASIPIINRAGILQVSPTASADLLTTGGGTGPQSLANLYPTGKRTFARVVPDDHLQALAQAQYQTQENCQRTFIARDGGVYGDNVAARVATADAQAGITVAGNATVPPSVTSFAKLTSAVAASGANCVFFGGNLGPHVAAMWQALGNVAGAPKLFAPDALGDASFTDAIGAAAERTFITSPGLAPSAYNDLGQQFYASYEARFGGFPTPEAIFGYEAMEAVLSSIRTAGGSRIGVIHQFFSISNRQSVLGPYSIDGNGDTTLNSYGAYIVSEGDLVFAHVLRPTVT